MAFPPRATTTRRLPEDEPTGRRRVRSASTVLGHCERRVLSPRTAPPRGRCGSAPAASRRSLRQGASELSPQVASRDHSTFDALRHPRKVTTKERFELCRVLTARPAGDEWLHAPCAACSRVGANNSQGALDRSTIARPAVRRPNWCSCDQQSGRDVRRRERLRPLPHRRRRPPPSDHDRGPAAPRPRPSAGVPGAIGRLKASSSRTLRSFVGRRRRQSGSRSWSLPTSRPKQFSGAG